MPRERTIQRLHDEWRALADAVDALPRAVLTQPDALGTWSVRDVLGHISTWEGEFLKALPLILAGERLPHYSTLYGGIDAFNAQEQGRWAGLSPPEVRRRLAETHATLLTTLEAVPQQAPGVEARLRRRLRQDTYNHYAEHATQVRSLALR